MRPRFTLYMLYLVGLFFVYALLLILPEMLDALDRLPPGTDPDAFAQQAAHQAAGPRLLPAFGLAFVTVALGAYYRVLPGLH